MTVTKVARLSLFRVKFVETVVEDRNVLKREDHCDVYEDGPNGIQAAIPNLFCKRTYFVRLSTQQLIPFPSGELYQFDFIIKDPSNPEDFVNAPQEMTADFAFGINERFAHGSDCIRASIERSFQYPNARSVERLGCICLVKVIRNARGEIEYIPPRSTTGRE